NRRGSSAVRWSAADTRPRVPAARWPQARRRRRVVIRVSWTSSHQRRADLRVEPARCADILDPGANGGNRSAGCPLFAIPRGSDKRRRMPVKILARSLVLVALTAGHAAAQDKGTLNPIPLPPLAHPDDPKTPARELFGRRTKPTHDEGRVFGFYSGGCRAGGAELPINGPTWQVMRLSRNRNWGHPELVKFLKRLSAKAAKFGWPGLLVGDMSQPRGGPMITGHASHQVGLDADIWLTPMPSRELSRAEREEMSATMVVANDRRDIDPKVWTPAHVAVIRTAAQDPEVARIFVNAAIKKALCRE